jgi:glycosylphosphatidylinositol deacylase
MSFSESMDVCLRTSLPFIFIALTFFAVSLSKASQGSLTRGWLSFLTGTSQRSVDFNVNDLMLGTQDPFLWFLVPLFGVISVGICIAGNYVITILMHMFAFVYGWTRSLFGGRDNNRYECTIIESLSDMIILLTAPTAYQRLSPQLVDASVSSLPLYFSFSSRP